MAAIPMFKACKPTVTGGRSSSIRITAGMLTVHYCLDGLDITVFLTLPAHDRNIIKVYVSADRAFLLLLLKLHVRVSCRVIR